MGKQSKIKKYYGKFSDQEVFLGEKIVQVNKIA